MRTGTKLGPLPRAFWIRSLFAGLIVAALTACGSHSFLNRVRGSGHPATEQRSVGSFSRIEIENSAEVEVSVGDSTSVAVTTDDNLLPLVKTTVAGDTLEIHSDDNLDASEGVKVKITTPALDSLAISGVGTIHATGVKTRAFAVKVNGSGNVSVQGTTESCSIVVAGAGQIKTGDLIAHDAIVNIQGAGAVTVYADRLLDASIQGAGAIRYLGNPVQVKKSVEGIGSIAPR